jgi:flagellar biosynthesis/type III secretory pathway M-ring protein FliF/YscJ
VKFSIFDENNSIMETASMPSFIKTLLWIVAIYYIVKFLARLFLPVVAKKVVEKATQQFQEQHQQQQQQQQKTQQNKTDKPKEKKIVGDYVDFEEIE